MHKKLKEFGERVEVWWTGMKPVELQPELSRAISEALDEEFDPNRKGYVSVGLGAKYRLQRALKEGMKHPFVCTVVATMVGVLLGALLTTK